MSYIAGDAGASLNSSRRSATRSRFAIPVMVAHSSSVISCLAVTGSNTFPMSVMVSSTVTPLDMEPLMPELVLVAGEWAAEEGDDTDEVAHSLETKNFGVMRPSASEMGDGVWQMGDEPRLSRNIFLCGGVEHVELLSSRSNLRFTGHSVLGRMALGDIERRVEKVLRVGLGDITWYRSPAPRLVGEGLEQLRGPPAGRFTCRGFVRSSFCKENQP